MIWLASYPRSGNTFVRNVLYEVYGLESSAFHNLKSRKLDPDYKQYPVVKTHLLPDQLEPADASIPVVYIVRDGRDALVSQAHHHINFIDPQANWTSILEEAVFASEGTYFGGWALNVAQWVQRADLLLRFEDIIKDPMEELEKLRTVIDLPEPNVSRLPRFEQLKFGKPKYGRSEGKGALNERFFRKGKTGTWKDEFPKWLFHYFWVYHGRVMEKMGYEKEGVHVKPLNLNQIKIELAGLDVYPDKLSFPDFMRLKIIRRLRKYHIMR
jgi:sulfotransferase family protein